MAVAAMRSDKDEVCALVGSNHETQRNRLRAMRDIALSLVEPTNLENVRDLEESNQLPGTLPRGLAIQYSAIFGIYFYVTNWCDLSPGYLGGRFTTVLE